MIPKFNKTHIRFKLNGSYFSREELKGVAYSFIKEGLPFEKSIGDFLLDWLNDKNHVKVNTSGSTGKPKTIKLDKQAMVNSAIATGDFFKLKPGDSALSCLPSNFIAGKMMLVRAIILALELELVAPSSNPLKNTHKAYDFCALTPLQVESSLNHINKIKTLIIGGAQVAASLKEQLKDKKVRAFETYGMTETITHISVKQLNNYYHSKQSEESYFKILPDIIISKDKRDCLVIEAPKLFQGQVVTNDIVKLHSEDEFEWLGRYDNVINSGGIKLFPEQIEAKLQSVITTRFFLASKPDKQLGEHIILLLEDDPLDVDAVMSKVRSLETLNKYEVPKQVFVLPKFIETGSGKIQRKKTLELI